MRKLTLLILIFTELVCGTTASQAQSAEYSMKFIGTWNANDINSAYPSGAHFSSLIGTTHQIGDQFWQSGGRASAGVEQVAELGFNSELRSELTASQNAGTTGEIIELQSLFSLPNSDVIEIEVTNDKPFITLITMVAPSPDWFIGVSGLSLLENNEWVRSLTVELRPYDAGTEEGDRFSLDNPASPSSARISKLTENDSPFIGRPVIGRLEFTLLNPPTVTPPIEPPIEPPIDSPINPPTSSGDAKALTALFLLLND